MKRPRSKFRLTRLAAPLTAAAIAAGAVASGAAAAPAPVYHTNYQPGKIVFVGDAIPHAPGVMVDRRIIPDLQYLAETYPIYVEEGYAGPLRGVGEVGCRSCHVKHSDHYHGLATDLAPLVLVALSLVACGSANDHKTPVACLGGPGSFAAALQGAPGHVTLSDGTPISGCIVKNQSVGDLANVGVTLVKVGTVLNAKA